VPGPIDESSVLIEGAWTHRFVSANGTRLHVAEAGAGPLVLLLHGFPECWAAWQHQITPLVGAGFRVAAVDLRGYGASDKPPRGYDGFTAAADLVGLIRGLGERSASLVGTGYGGQVAWTTAALHPRSVDRLMVLGAAHPARIYSSLLSGKRSQLSAVGPMLAFQVPRFEHRLTRADAELVEEYLCRWSAPAWQRTADFAEYADLCRTAMLIPQTAFCAMEAFRWSMRSLLRPHGHRFRSHVREPIVSPTLQLHGGRDPVVLPATALGSGRYVIAAYEWRLLPEVGHFPHREAPDLVTGEIIRWMKEPSSGGARFDERGS
jgi:pimeloyl-ACP methyl ester carboxylesterase